MAIERKNPLPLGTYWVDVFGEARPKFNTWLSENSAKLRVIRTAAFDAIDGYPARDWVLFQVNEPVNWKGPGFPSIAEFGENTDVDDTVDKPPPPKDVIDQVTDYIDDLDPIATGGKAVVTGIGIVFGTAIGGWFLMKWAERKRK